jgi:hypothetical protein
VRSVPDPPASTAPRAREGIETHGIENLHYALGWFTADVRGVHLVYHNGGNPGFRAAVVLAPSSKAGVVVLTNGESKPFIEMTTRSLLEQLLR